MSAAAPPLFFIFNAASGHDDTREIVQHVAALLRAAGRPAELLVAGQPGELGALIGRAINGARDARGVVVAVGGDGTLNAVAQAVWNAGLVMGVLPQGTFNFFGRVNGMPTDIGAAVDALLNARIEPVPVGMVGDRLFLVNASVGMYPQLLEEREQAKRRYGRSRWVALLSGLFTLLRGGSVMTLELQGGADTRVVRTRTLFVGNNELQLRAVGLREAPEVEAGRLVAITLQPLSKLRTLWMIVRGVMGRLDGAQGVDSFAFDRLVVQPRRRAVSAKVAIDGEIFRLPTPLIFRIAPRPLQLLVPAHQDGEGAP